MTVRVLDNLDMSDGQVYNLVLQVLAADPNGVDGKVYFNSVSDEIRYFADGVWRSLGESGTGGPPSGPAGGDLTGSYPNPQVLDDSHNHSDKADVTVVLAAGAGLTGGGTIASNRTFDVGAGTGITVGADTVSLDTTFADARYEPNGAVATHAAAPDPHTGYQKESEKGVANGYAPLDTNALLPTVHLPPLAISETFVVANEAEMLALDAQTGDLAIRTDNGKTYILSGDSSVLADWKELQATGQVVSVNGMTGVVLLDYSHVGAPPTARNLIAGSGLTGGGTLAADRTFNVGAGTGITVNPDDVALNLTYTDGRYSQAGHVHPPQSLKYTQTLSTSATSYVITHNLGTRDIACTVWEVASPYRQVQTGIEATTINTATIYFNQAPAAGEYRVVILA